MPETTTNQPTQPASTPAPAPATSPDDRLMSVREAARQLAQWRTEKNREEQHSVEDAPPDETSSEPSEEAAPPIEEPSGETPEAEPEAQELPPIEPPGSWAAEEKQRFAELPRDLQHYIAERETQRDTEVRRRQNEVAEWLQRLAPEQQALMQARAQYEQALPAVMQALQSTGEWADIRSYDDVEKLAKEDWPRYVQFDAHLKKVQAVQQELAVAQQRQQQEYFSNWSAYAAEQDRLFAERVPEFADADKAKTIQQQAIDTLEKDYGFSLQEMQAAWAGAFRDHRVQQILLDATRYRQLAKNKPRPVDRTLPPVQRPGTASAPGRAKEQTIKALDQRIDQTTGQKQLRMAAQYLAARRNAGR